jgi:hypothetical protein
MSFWAWGREQEQKFEDSNTENLNRVIIRQSSLSSSHQPKASTTTKTDISPVQPNDIQMEMDTEEDQGDSLWLAASGDHGVKLERIPLMAVFHKNDSAGRGVPHSFASFLRRYPALPQVVVRSDCLLSNVAGCELMRGGGVRYSSQRGLWVYRMYLFKIGISLPKSDPSLVSSPLQ